MRSVGLLFILLKENNVSSFTVNRGPDDLH